MRVAIFGTTGMLGHEVEKIFSAEKFEVISLNRNKIDALSCSAEDIRKQIGGVSRIINCVGLIKHRTQNNYAKNAIAINSLFPFKLSEAAKTLDAKVIQIATDCVYDGQKGFYTESDFHNAVDVYGKTKSLGEVKSDNFINLRCSIIGKEIKNKTSLLEWFLCQPKNARISGYLNHFWNGITTTAFAKICVGIIRNDLQPTCSQHIVPADVMCKADMLHLFGEIFGRKDIFIENISADVGINRTLSTENSGMNQKIWSAAGYKKIPTIREMVGEIL
jgi:dTDP-4-dehydrorhamnose reductase